MNLVVYIDAFFLVNFCMNLVILWILKKLTNQRTTIWRLCLAGFIGSIGACFTVIFPWINVLFRFVFLNIFISGVMVFIAFPNENHTNLVKNIIWLYIVSFFVGGVFQYLYYSTDFKFFLGDLRKNTLYHNFGIKNIVISVAILSLLIMVFIQSFLSLRQNINTIFSVELSYGGKTVEGMGLLDTGNRLRDPISHKPVSIVEYRLIEPLFSEEERNYLKDYTKINERDNIPVMLRIIPYHSVGNSNGMLPGIIFDGMNICVNHKKIQNEGVLLAIYPQKLSSRGDYQIVLHEECI